MVGTDRPPRVSQFSQCGLSFTNAVQELDGVESRPLFLERLLDPCLDRSVRE